MPLFSCSSCSHLCVNMWVWTSMTVIVNSPCLRGWGWRTPGATGWAAGPGCFTFNMLNDSHPQETFPMKRRHFAALAAATLAVASLAAPAAFAQERTMRIWVGFPPGGSADVIARLLADKLRVSLHQNVIVENKPGAAGRLVLGEPKRAAPDGQ